MYTRGVSQRRSLGGARREATARVLIRSDGFETEAWTLNVSRGGLRVVLEEPVTIGSDYMVVIGEQEPRWVRAVWVRDESDGQIAGLQFLDVEGAEAPSYAPSSAPPKPPTNTA